MTRAANAPTFRPAVWSVDGVVATPHYLASLAAAGVLRDGGSAVDAAIAANAVLAVAWPHMCGLGGDLFAQVWSAGEGRLVGLNASGRAGGRMTLDAYRARGLCTVPQRGAFAVTAPGAVAGWFALHDRWGRLEMSRLLQDAIRLAHEGLALTERVCGSIRANAALLVEAGAEDVFLPGGAAPEPGQRFVQADLARSLALVAEAGPSAFYSGDLPERIAGAVQARGGLLDADDLARHEVEWVQPLTASYQGVEVAELPPNTQGLTVLQILGMLASEQGTPPARGSARQIHRLVEMKKLAFADRNQFIGDPSLVEVPVDRLLNPEYLADRAREIGERPVHAAGGASAGSGDTVYLCTADREGNMVSLIQSLYSAWGAGIMVPSTGILLHNRGFSFRLVDGHPNALRPGARPMHTLIPGFALRGGTPWMAFGTRGADGQAQTAVQILTGLLDYGMAPQAAVEAPRWVHGAPDAAFPQTTLVLESRFGAGVARELSDRGHEVAVSGPLEFAMGSVQLIQRDQARGAYTAASDPRGDGVALAA